MTKVDDDEMDASLDATLRVSPFLLKSMFDIIDGSSTLITELIDLLIQSGAISERDTREMLERLKAEYSDRHPADLAASTVTGVHDIFALSARSRVYAYGRLLCERRKREHTAGLRRRRGEEDLATLLHGADQEAAEALRQNADAFPDPDNQIRMQTL
jgi:hypothetical protein